MVRSSALILLMLAVPASGFSQNQTPSDGALATVQTFLRGFETADLDLLISTLDDGATVFFPFRPQRASGKAEVRAVFGEVFEQIGALTITPHDVEVQQFDDSAIVTAHLRTLPDPVLEPITFPRRTFVLRRLANGWLIVHIHASDPPVAPTRN